MIFTIILIFIFSLNIFFIVFIDLIIFKSLLNIQL